MIERITDMPPGTIGFRVAGEVEREDYDNVLTPELERTLEAGPLRTLYVIETLDEIEPAALWADAKVGFDLGVRHRGSWVRSAIVTDIHWMAQATKLFAWMIPGEVRVFPLAEVGEGLDRGGLSGSGSDSGALTAVSAAAGSRKATSNTDRLQTAARALPHGLHVSLPGPPT